MAAARRSHLTEIGCIACDELEVLGAGEKEGWLDDPSLLTALHPHCLALASSAAGRGAPFVIVLGWDSDQRPLKIHPFLSPSDGFITALEWLPFGDFVALALGTSGGYLLIYSLDGDLIHKQFVHLSCVLRLRFREFSGGQVQDSVSEEVSVVFSGVIARFDGSVMKSLLQRWFQEGRSQRWDNSIGKDPDDESSYERIPFQLWNVGKYGSCVDAAITGLMPPPLLDVQLLLLLGSQVNATIVQSQLDMMQ